MDFPVESDDQVPQIAISFKKQIVFTAHAASQTADPKHAASADEQLFINGEKELMIDSNSAASIKGLVVHKQGNFRDSKIFNII